jgi:hypothetical protein
MGDLVRPAWALRTQTHAYVFLSSIKLEEFHGHVDLRQTLLFRCSSLYFLRRVSQKLALLFHLEILQACGPPDW